MIGTWSPGLGDPSIGGWLTVLLYAATAASIWMLLRRIDFARQDRERWVWQLLLMALIALGINKQLDLQSALTELGRIVAQREGWYESRRQTQLAFIAGAGILGLTFMATLILLAWGSHRATLSALIGGFALLLFVMIRAASFHQVDRLLSANFAGLRYNWIIEMGGLTWILASSMRRLRNA